MLRLKFKKVNKDRLYYDQFRYCLGFSLNEVTALRSLDHDEIDSAIERRKAWRQSSQRRWANNRPKFMPVMRASFPEITDEIVQNLHSLADLLTATTAEFKLVITVNRAWIYSNNLKFLNQLNTLECLANKHYSQAQVTRPKNTIQLKKSKFAYRSYFRFVKLTPQQVNNLAGFFENHHEHIRISPALLQWTAMPGTRFQDYFFIDHDSPSWLTMISLVHPGLVRKTLDIVCAK
jgi:hypothetical protein